MNLPKINFIKPALTKLLVVPTLLAGFGLMTAGEVAAQTLTNLYNFSSLTSLTNSDGASPAAGLVLSGSKLYGTAQNGGSLGRGSIFAINVDGTGFTNLHSFVSATDGEYPLASLVLSGSTLYGTAQGGGVSGRGTVFKINTNGTSFTILHNFAPGFTNSGGSDPFGGLIISGPNLYGTTFGGGAFGRGTVFTLKSNGTGFTSLHSFNGTNGSNPTAALLLAGNTLFGTAYQGGITNDGVVFAIKTDGTGFTNLHHFTDVDGANPYAGLILSGQTLYGNTRYGGISNVGAVFGINTNGTGFTNLHSFTVGDGANPNATLSVSNNALYGTAYRGGNSNKGTVFAVNTNGAGFTVLYHFTATAQTPPFNNNDGANPVCDLVLFGDTIYGTTSTGGSAGNGTIFSLSLAAPPPPPPFLSINVAGPNIVLTWPTNAGGFVLQSTTNLNSPIVWNTVTPAPGIVGNQNAVTNPIVGVQKFYRLSQ